MPMTKHKIYYLPGLISLSLLPLLIVQWASQRNTPCHAIEIYMPSLKHHEVSPEYINLRNYNTLTITDNAEVNEIYFRFAEIKLREQKTTGDTFNGIHFHFEKSSHYKDLIRVINMTLKNDINQWIILGRDLWIVESPTTPSSLQNYPGFGSCITTAPCGGQRFVQPDLHETDNVLHYLYSQKPKATTATFLFIAMIVLTIRWHFSQRKLMKR